MDLRTYRQVRTFIVSLLATALVRTVWAEPVSPPVEFHIEGGDATSTLTEFSRQAHLQLLFDYNVVKGHTTKPLEGTFLPSDALRQLLANTDLEFDFVNERTLAVTQKRGPDEPAKVAAAEPKREVRRARSKSSALSSDGPANAVDVIRITGTYVRDEPPVGEETLSFSREDIESTGAATPADFLRTLPQTFGGGPNQDTYIGSEALTNSGLGVGVNLRGLGARATLVLINGRRAAPSGTEGEYVDIENIPLSALERIDILPDSASATYGADAVGGVVNFILLDKLDAAETIARGGSGTRGDLQEYLFSQSLGKAWEGGHGLISFEFYDRGALPAADRAYAVSDLRPFGGSDLDTNATNPGNIINPATGQTWAIRAGQNGTHLTAADLVPGTQNLQSRYLDGKQIVPSQERWTFYGSGLQALGERVTSFTDLLLGHRDAKINNGDLAGKIAVPSTNAFYINPAGGTAPIQLGYNFGKDLGRLITDTRIDTLNATVGFDVDAGASWSVKTFASYAREKQNQLAHGEPNLSELALALADPNPSTAFNPFGDGSNTSAATLARIRTDANFWLDSQLKTAEIAADGPIAKLAGIPLKMALGAQWRDQRFATSELSPGSQGQAVLDRSLGRTVVSAFGQLVAPLFTAQNALPGLSRLDLSAATRYENYTGYGGATTPKYGIVWSPFNGVAFRGTWSRSVRPPTLVDLDGSHNSAVSIPLPDPSAPGGLRTALVWGGGNGNVHPEHAESWTAGFDLAPAPLAGFSLGLTYFRTVFNDRIQRTVLTPTVLSDPSYATIVTRNPSAAQIDYICSHSAAFSAQGTSINCAGTPFGAIVDLRVRNLATLLTDGIDFNSNYERATSFGILHFHLDGTWLRDFSEAQLPGQPPVSLLDTQNEPINLRLRTSAGLQYRRWDGLIATNFTNGYRDIASTPARSVSAWTTVDLQLGYDFPDSPGSWSQGLRIEMNARNVFNVDPPFLNNQLTYIGYDQENANPYGRQLSLQLRKIW